MTAFVVGMVKDVMVEVVVVVMVEVNALACAVMVRDLILEVCT